MPERSLREAMARHDHHIGVEHLTLALAWMPGGMAPRILPRDRISVAWVRITIQDRYRRAG